MCVKGKVDYSNMLNYIMLNYDYLSNDHMAKISKEAQLYYIKLMFHSNCGFVANPITILDSMGYDKSVLQELINNGEILTLEGRDEVFITSFYIHNHRFKTYSWLKTPFAQYWKGKLWIKENGIATLKPQKKQAPHQKSVNDLEKEAMAQEKIQTEQEETEIVSPNVSWDELCDTIDTNKA